MDIVKQQYEVYPYPAREAGDEKKRLITGSPSNPVEMDHMLFSGKKDWSKPFKALVAGGGTGDGLIQLAQRLAWMKCPADITYIDMSAASREIAEARAKIRGLDHINFITADLLSAPEYGPFDYIDCCGVLHHLPDPQAGFNALAQALKPNGSVGAMVYAPYGRNGVYEMQSALRNMIPEHNTPEEKVFLAKQVLESLPETNLFKNNPHVSDHNNSDAGLFDLLLHGRDRSYTVRDVQNALQKAGLELTSFISPARYDPASYLGDDLCKNVDNPAAVAEEISGNMRVHVFYAGHKGHTPQIATVTPDAVPRLTDMTGPALAQTIQKRGRVRLTADEIPFTCKPAKQVAQIIARIDGQRNLGQIQQMLNMDWISFASLFSPLQKFLTGHGVLYFSKGAR